MMIFNRLDTVKTLLALVIGIGMGDFAQGKIEESVFRYVITETGAATSFDPLDADSTNNLQVARMLYATPLESSSANQLESQVLESFRFDAKTRTIEWLVRKDLRYSDGTAITTDDVAFAVLRMAYARPKFPVINAIEGLEPWVAKTNALMSFPKGISVSGNKIIIKFDREVDHPLFRFCLEVFSIIPKRCVDLTTNKVTCSTVPSSGRYTLTKHAQTELQFTKHAHATDQHAPERINFEYLKPTELAGRLPSLDERTVVAGNELSFTAAQMSAVEKSLNTKFMPAARYASLHINQAVEPFKEKKCRKLFADTFRRAFNDAFKEDSHEVSLFTKILPGYLSSQEIGKVPPLTAGDDKGCRDALSKSKISWGFPESEKDAKFFVALKNALERLGIKSDGGISFTDRKQFAEAFADGRIAFYYGGSGFWALDPAGDVQMLFTPNLHKPLQHLSGDKRLQQLIGELETPESFRDLNRFVYADARLNIYTHVRRFFASKNKSLLEEVPFAITSPAPWQVFEARR